MDMWAPRRGAEWFFGFGMAGIVGRRSQVCHACIAQQGRHANEAVARTHSRVTMASVPVKVFAVAPIAVQFAPDVDADTLI